MRAKDYIAYNIGTLKFADELKTTIDRFLDCRTNFSLTCRYYTSHLKEPEKWVKFIEKCLNKKIDIQKHWSFMQELETCISTDLSFSYLQGCIANRNKTEKNVITSEQIEQYISNQYENYPRPCIDDYLTNSINIAFVETLDSRDYTEQEELDIFNSAYRLFDEIRQQVKKIRHAAHIYKEFGMNTEQMKDDVLRLLSFYIHDYNYDISDFQRAQLDTISNNLGKYIQQRNNKHTSNLEAKEKWKTLKCTIDNMISDEEKLKMLISERTAFQQLSIDEQKQIDVQFADKCQLEINKIKEIQSIPQSNSDSDIDANSTPKRTMKVTSDTVLLLLKELKATQSTDNTVIAAFTNYLTGFSAEKIRQRLSNTEELTSKHKKEVEFVNNLLSNLNIKKTITYNKNR